MLTYSFNDFIHDILCVVVIYKTKLLNSESFCSICDSLKTSGCILDILVYDNSPEPYYNPLVSEHASVKINYIHDQSNSGVSKAYNYGHKLAETNNKKWLMLVDQDSKFSENIFKAYYLSIIENADIELFVPKLINNGKILSPCNYFFRRGSSKNSVEIGRHQFNNISVLNSGILISVIAFEKAGGYNEKIRLDFADFYFIDHFKKHFNYFVVIDSICNHELSSNEEDIGKVITRFNFYCNGAKEYSESLFSFFNLLILCLIRAIKLSGKFKNISFFRSVLRYYLGNSSI